MNVRKSLWLAYESIASALQVTRINKLPLGSGITLGKLGDFFVRRALSFTFADRPVVVQGHKMRLGEDHQLLVGRYERGMTRLFENVLREGMTVVDVGAHVGYYTLLAAKCVGDSGRVYAFEPEPHNYEMLIGNVLMNGYRNVVMIKEAISDTSGVAKLHLEESMGHSLYLGRHPSRRSIVVKTVTLDDFFESLGWPDVHLIKMDIEGGEPAAIQGCAKLLRRCRDLKIILEFLPAKLRSAGVEPESFLHQLQAQGFDLRVVNDDEGLRSLRFGDLLSRMRGGIQAVNIFCEREM